MSLSLKSGFPFAMIDNKVVYINDSENTDDNMLGRFVDIGMNKTFQLMPPNDAFRIFIAAPAGAGKSTFTANLLKQYKKKYKKNKIYMVSPTQDDPAYKDLMNDIEFIKIDDSIITDAIDFKEFNDCIFVFDDTESLTGNKDINKQVELFRDSCLQNGRKSRISVICILHIAMAGPSTKKVISECDEAVLFPRSNFSMVSRLCKSYYGFGKDDLEYVRTIKSRWIVIKRTYLQAILSEHQIKLL